MSFQPKNFDAASLGLEHLCPFRGKVDSRECTKLGFFDIRGFPNNGSYRFPVNFAVMEVCVYEGTYYTDYNSCFRTTSTGLNSIKMRRSAEGNGFYLVRDFEVMRRLAQLNKLNGFCGGEITNFLLILMKVMSDAKTTTE